MMEGKNEKTQDINLQWFLETADITKDQQHLGFELHQLQLLSSRPSFNAYFFFTFCSRLLLNILCILKFRPWEMNATKHKQCCCVWHEEPLKRYHYKYLRACPVATICFPVMSSFLFVVDNFLLRCGWYMLNTFFLLNCCNVVSRWVPEAVLNTAKCLPKPRISGEIASLSNWVESLSVWTFSGSHNQIWFSSCKWVQVALILLRLIQYSCNLGPVPEITVFCDDGLFWKASVVARSGHTLPLLCTASEIHFGQPYHTFARLHKAFFFWFSLGLDLPSLTEWCHWYISHRS